MAKTFNLKRTLDYILWKMYQTNLSQVDYAKLEKTAKYCINQEGDDAYKAELVYARLLYEEGKYLASRNQYNRAKLKNPNAAPIYYGLYKNYIMEGKWELALENLNIYLNMVGETKRVDGFNIIYALLAYLRDEAVELEIPLDIYLSQDIKNQKIEDKYEELINSIVDGKYALAINITEELEKISREDKNMMEFVTMKKILEHALRKKNLEFKKYSISKINEALKNENYGLLCDILYYHAQNENSRIEVMDYMPALIDNGYSKEAKDILNIRKFNRDNHRIRAYYRKAIKDHEIMDNYSEEEAEYHNSALETIENAFLAEEYIDAFNMAEAAMYKLDHPIFLYYMGLSAFYLEDYISAISYFVAYNRRGAEKNIDSRFFLTCSYKNLGGGKRYQRHRRRYIRYCNLLNKPKNMNFNAYSYEPYYEEEREVNEGYEIYIIKHHPLYRELKYLLKHFNEKEANAILKRLERKTDKTDEDKLILKYINKNKTLYLNKNK